MLFADDAACLGNTLRESNAEAYQQIRQRENFGLTTSLKKTNVSAQNVSQAPVIKIGDNTLDVVGEFTYLGSTVFMNLSLDSTRNLPKNLQSHRHHVQIDQESLEKQMSDWKRPNAHLPGMRSLQVALR